MSETELYHILNNGKIFEYRNSKCCTNNIRGESPYGIVYVTDEYYALNKEAVKYLANRFNISLNEVIDILEQFKSREILNCDITIRTPEGKGYRRNVFRIKR